MVTHDYSVRSSSGSIVQFIYGNDGMDATFVESQPLNLTKLTLEDIIDKYQYFTQSNMQKLRSIGYQNLFTTLENGVEDYVRSYLIKREYY